MDDIHKKVVEQLRMHFNLQLLMADKVSASKLRALLEMSDEILSLAHQFNKQMSFKVDERVEKIHGKEHKETK